MTTNSTATNVQPTKVKNWRFAAAVVAGMIAATGGLMIGTTSSEAQRAQPYARSEQSNSTLRGGVPGRFDYYALSLSWSPSFCAENPRGERDPQCARNSGRPYAFVLHGLWPQYERGFPDSCPTPEQPFVQNKTIDRMLDVMPSRPLIIHEYRKHGVCSGLQPDAYFDLARKLFTKIKVPQRFVGPVANQMVDTAQVIGEFVAANPGLRPEMLGVTCGGAGNRLREVRICFSREGEFRPCGSNENQRRMCNSPRVFVPPVRVGADGGAGGARGRGPGTPLPAAPAAPGERSL